MDEHLTLLENVQKLISDSLKDPSKRAKILAVMKTQSKAEVYTWEMCYPKDLLENDPFYDVWKKLEDIVNQ